MATWLYQMNQQSWPPHRYRLEIWENQTWAWPPGKMARPGTPAAGDIIVFFYSKSGGTDPGFYGWAVITEFPDESETRMYFRPVAPSDELKMSPWWGDDAERVANDIRGAVKQGTMWPISDEARTRVRDGIRRWLSGVRK